MRSTVEIILAVQGSKPATDEELRMALLALNSIDSFRERTILRLVDAIEHKKPEIVAVFAKEASRQRDTLFYAMKKDPQEWLGADHIPGNPQYERRRRVGLALLDRIISQEKPTEKTP